MKKFAVILLSLIILNVFASCNGSGENTLEVYLVSGDLPSDGKIDINKLELEDTPVFTLDDIQKYYWEHQAFVMKKDLLNERLNAEPGKIPVPTYGKPYVLVVNGERIYMGKFWSMLSSQLEVFTPLIYVEFAWGKDNEQYDLQHDQKLYAVTWNLVENAENAGKLKKELANKIYDKRIYKVLKNAGVLVEKEEKK